LTTYYGGTNHGETLKGITPSRGGGWTTHDEGGGGPEKARGKATSLEFLNSFRELIPNADIGVPSVPTRTGTMGGEGSEGRR